MSTAIVPWTLEIPIWLGDVLIGYLPDVDVDLQVHADMTLEMVHITGRNAPGPDYSTTVMYRMVTARSAEPLGRSIWRAALIACEVSGPLRARVEDAFHETTLDRRERQHDQHGA